jgi:hypothetical protein
VSRKTNGDSHAFNLTKTNRRQLKHAEAKSKTGELKTPWGWGGKHEHHFLSDLQAMATKLSQKRELKTSSTYRQRSKESLKTMVEDRYGSFRPDPTMTEIEYQAIKVPGYVMRSQHDQMNNEVSMIDPEKLDRLSTKGKTSARKEQMRGSIGMDTAVEKRPRAAGVKVANVKAPWGW